MSTRLEYRPELDGLRAIAVTAVILYHLGFPYTPGGFVGVDVFLVLSGFLITRQIELELREGRFSLIDFYDRRIRRIFPALFAMLFASALAATFVLFPSSLIDFGRSLIAAAFAASNFHFWLEAGYFAPDAETMPLLHTWSLAVEEQFYVLYPVLLLLLWKLGRPRVLLVFAALAALSFGIGLWSTRTAPEAAFYLLPARGWELLLGGLLALAPLRPARFRYLRSAAAIAGMAGILAAVFALDASVPFPGIAAALPCVGSALLIWAGTPDPSSRPASPPFVLRLMALPPIVGLGLISYSVYLWHWPLLVFARQISPEPLSPAQKAFIVVLTLAVSYASWRLIEQPLRRGGLFWPTLGDRLKRAGVAAGVCAVLGVTVVLTRGMPWLLPADVRAAIDEEKDKSPYRERCNIEFSKQGRLDLADTCLLGPASSRKIVVLADSHGVEISYALSELAQAGKFQVLQVTASGCPPVLGASAHRRPACLEHVERMMRGLAQMPPSTVLIASFYFQWARRAQHEAFWTGLDMTVARLREMGHDVVLLGGWPRHANGRLPTTLAKEIRFGRPAAAYGFPIDHTLAEDIDQRLTGIAKRHSATYVPLLIAVCGTKERCRAFVDGDGIYFDDDHLTLKSARRVVRDQIMPVIAQRAPDPKSPARQR